MPPAGYEGAIVEDNKAIATGHFRVDDFLCIFAVFAEFFQALSVQCIEVSVVAFQPIYPRVLGYFSVTSVSSQRIDTARAAVREIGRASGRERVCQYV